MVKKLLFIIFREDNPGFNFLKIVGLVVSFIIITSLFSPQNFFKSNTVNSAAVADCYVWLKQTQ